MLRRGSRAVTYAVNLAAGRSTSHEALWFPASGLSVTLGDQDSPPHYQHMHTTSKGSLWMDSWLKPDQKEAETVNLKRSTEFTESLGSSATVLRLNKMCETGMLDEAVHALDILYQKDIRVSSHILSRVLQIALAKKDFAVGKRVHGHIVNHGLDSSNILGNLLIRFFSVFGDLEGARKAFYKLSSPEVDTWRAIITVHVKQGQYAVQLYHEMLQSGCEPNSHVYVAILKACATMAALDHGRLIHSQVIATGHEQNLFVSSTLIDMYVKCGSLEDACALYRKLPKRDMVSCNSLLAGYAEYGRGPDAVTLFKEMLQEGLKPDNATFLSIVRAFGHISALHEAKQMLASMTELGLTLNVALTNSLIDLFIKCGSVDDARQIFEASSKKNAVSWNTMIDGYIHGGHFQQAFELFVILVDEGCRLDEDMVVTILKACRSPDDLEKGQTICSELLKRGLDAESRVELAMNEMYERCGGHS